MLGKKIESYIFTMVLAVLSLFITVPAHAYVINQLTNWGINQTPDIDGSNIIWIKNGRIYRWDGTAETLVMGNSNGTIAAPAISGTNMVFQRYDGTGPDGWDVYHRPSLDLVSTINILSGNNYWDGMPDIQGSNIVWSSHFSETGPYHIMYSDDLGATAQNISFGVSNTAQGGPAVYGTGVAWSGWTGSAWDILYWDGSSAINLSTGYSTDNANPAIYGSNVVWRGFDGNDWEIYLWDGAAVTQITDNDYNDENPAIWGSNIVWEGWSGDAEIYLWDGSITQQITNNNFNDQMPAISGSTIVWKGGTDIYMASVPEPASLLLIGTGIIGMVGFKRKQWK